MHSSGSNPSPGEVAALRADIMSQQQALEQLNTTLTTSGSPPNPAIAGLITSLQALSRQLAPPAPGQLVQADALRQTQTQFTELKARIEAEIRTLRPQQEDVTQQTAILLTRIKRFHTAMNAALIADTIPAWNTAQRELEDVIGEFEGSIQPNFNNLLLLLSKLRNPSTADNNPADFRQAVQAYQGYLNSERFLQPLANHEFFANARDREVIKFPAARPRYLLDDTALQKATELVRAIVPILTRDDLHGDTLTDDIARLRTYATRNFRGDLQTAALALVTAVDQVKRDPHSADKKSHARQALETMQRAMPNAYDTDSNITAAGETYWEALSPLVNPIDNAAPLAVAPGARPAPVANPAILGHLTSLVTSTQILLTNPDLDADGLATALDALRGNVNTRFPDAIKTTALALINTIDALKQNPTNLPQQGAVGLGIRELLQSIPGAYDAGRPPTLTAAGQAYEHALTPLRDDIGNTVALVVRPPHPAPGGSPIPPFKAALLGMLQTHGDDYDRAYRVAAGIIDTLPAAAQDAANALFNAINELDANTPIPHPITRLLTEFNNAYATTTPGTPTPADQDPAINAAATQFVALARVTEFKQAAHHAITQRHDDTAYATAKATLGEKINALTSAQDEARNIEAAIDGLRAGNPDTVQPLVDAITAYNTAILPSTNSDYDEEMTSAARTYATPVAPAPIADPTTLLHLHNLVHAIDVMLTAAGPHVLTNDTFAAAITSQKRQIGIEFSGNAQARALELMDAIERVKRDPSATNKQAAQDAVEALQLAMPNAYDARGTTPAGDAYWDELSTLTAPINNPSRLRPVPPPHRPGAVVDINDQLTHLDRLFIKILADTVSAKMAANVLTTELGAIISSIPDAPAVRNIKTRLETLQVSLNLSTTADATTTEDVKKEQKQKAVLQAVSDLKYALNTYRGTKPATLHTHLKNAGEKVGQGLRSFKQLTEEFDIIHRKLDEACKQLPTKVDKKASGLAGLMTRRGKHLQDPLEYIKSIVALSRSSTTLTSQPQLANAIKTIEQLRDGIGAAFRAKPEHPRALDDFTVLCQSAINNLKAREGLIPTFGADYARVEYNGATDDFSAKLQAQTERAQAKYPDLSSTAPAVHAAVSSRGGTGTPLAEGVDSTHFLHGVLTLSGDRHAILVAKRDENGHGRTELMHIPDHLDVKKIWDEVVGALASKHFTEMTPDYFNQMFNFANDRARNEGRHIEKEDIVAFLKKAGHPNPKNAASDFFNPLKAKYNERMYVTFDVKTTAEKFTHPFQKITVSFPHPDIVKMAIELVNKKRQIDPDNPQVVIHRANSKALAQAMVLYCLAHKIPVIDQSGYKQTDNAIPRETVDQFLHYLQDKSAACGYSLSAAKDEKHTQKVMPDLYPHLKPGGPK